MAGYLLQAGVAHLDRAGGIRYNYQDFCSLQAKNRKKEEGAEC
jgi:hypothetical protein